MKPTEAAPYRVEGPRASLSGEVFDVFDSSGPVRTGMTYERDAENYCATLNAAHAAGRAEAEARCAALSEALTDAQRIADETSAAHSGAAKQAEKAGASARSNLHLAAAVSTQELAAAIHGIREAADALNTIERTTADLSIQSIARRGLQHVRRALEPDGSQRAADQAVHKEYGDWIVTHAKKWGDYWDESPLDGFERIIFTLDEKAEAALGACRAAKLALDLSITKGAHHSLDATVAHAKRLVDAALAAAKVQP